jgi:agmatine deiminase
MLAALFTIVGILNHTTTLADVERVIDWFACSPMPSLSDPSAQIALSVEDREPSLTDGWSGGTAAFRADEIAAMPLFADVPPAHLSRIARWSRQLRLGAGETVVERWDSVRDLYVIVPIAGRQASGRRARADAQDVTRVSASEEIQDATARGLGMAMPAEWSTHELTLMAWPARLELWGEGLAEAKAEYAAVARAIAAFERVVMVAPEGASQEVRDACGSGVRVLELPIDDSWMRDSGPIVVTAPDGRRAGVDFRFNGWGEKFAPYDRDDAMNLSLLAQLRIDRLVADLVLEGGSISVDGEGTLIATEQCLLHPSRNPSLTREEIEACLREYLGVEEVIWIGHGLIEDHDTDGHVDNVAQFAAPGVVLAQTVDDPADPNHEPLAENVERLRSAVDARGRRLQVIEIGVLPRTTVREASGVVPYVNLYVANGVVVVPTCGDDPDRDAEVLGRLASVYAGREVLGVPARMLAEGGGGVHCITQQVPFADPGP